MSRSVRKVPSYCHHKASGQAVVRVDGQDVYLGTYGSPESHQRYQAVIAEWRARHAQSRARALPAHASRPGVLLLTISQLIARYREFAKGYYCFEGQPTKEFSRIKYALRPLRQLYGESLASEFGPLKLKALQQHLIQQGLCRRLINSRVNLMRRFFKWAVSEELLPSAVLESLRTVDGLRYGRTPARESAPVRPVADADVDATLARVSPPVAAMIRLQRLTGMRPGEVILMRPVDLDRSDEIWIYSPQSHKNLWRGHVRRVPLGPQSQAILAPFLEGRSNDAFLFSPAEAEIWRNEQRALHRKPDRKTKIYPSELKARERRKAQPRRPSVRPKQARYDVDSYRRAISYGIQKGRKVGLTINHWHPNQLRHSRGTELRRAYGIEAAQVSLGHAHANITEIYAERNFAQAIEIARKLG